MEGGLKITTEEGSWIGKCLHVSPIFLDFFQIAELFPECSQLLSAGDSAQRRGERLHHQQGRREALLPVLRRRLRPRPRHHGPREIGPCHLRREIRHR